MSFYWGAVCGAVIATLILACFIAGGDEYHDSDS